MKVIDLKEKPIRIRIPGFFIPFELSRKYRNIVKTENMIKRLKYKYDASNRLT